LEHRRIFFILFLALFVAMLGAGVIAPTIPLYAKTLGATGIWLGLIYSAFSVSRVIFMPMAGKLSDRRGRKVFIATGLMIYALASLGYVWSHSIFEMVWIRFLHGIGSAMVVPIAAAAIGDISPAGKEGSVMGTFNVALFLGYGAGPLLGGIVMDVVGMNEVFYLMGGLSFLSLVLVLFLPENKNAVKERVRTITPFLKIWRHDVFKELLIFRFSNAVVRGSLMVFLPVFATKLDISAAQVGLLVALNILLTAVLQHFFGGLADRMNRHFLMIVGNTITAIPMLFIPTATSLAHFLILGVIMGIGGGLAFPAALAVATELGRKHGMGNIMGFFNQSMSLGMIVGPVTAGWVMDLLGISVVFTFVGFLGMMGSGVCVYYLYRRRGVVFDANV
jgi:DHA1 family multidrug resistance protein-like MFS transporter